mmetsp:Transcript_7736/g.10921  ORF Transcript_7736/g.10921 Transcript_7736/m.10921 type:complete len:137 (+) Transcript_7736:55-465(+)
MYRTVGAVNGPGWRPMPDRPVLETSKVLMLDKQIDSAKVSPLGFRNQSKRKERPTKLSPIDNKQVTPKTIDKMTVATMPWSTKKYSINNSSTNRTRKENALGIFPMQRRSLGAMHSPAQKTVENAKAGTFAFGGKV